MNISLRQAGKEDFEFLWNLHKATMKNYVDEVWGWDEQFQKEYFKDNFDVMNTRLIIFEGSKIGVLEIHERENELFLANLEIAPDFQNKGIGSAILKKVIATSVNKQKPLTLQVLKVNPAQQFYKDLGFKKVDETETHLLMERGVHS